MIIFSEIDKCLSNPCQTNAHCINTAEHYICECDEGFTGSGNICSGIYVVSIEYMYIECMSVRIGHSS